MKPFKLLLLPLLPALFLYAKPSSLQIPKNIETKLCKKLLNKPCNENLLLESDYHFDLDENKTLFFFHIYQKNALYQHGYKNLSATVDSKEQWKVSDNIIDAEIQEVVKDPKGGIWLRALWMIEGVSPYLYYSTDAIKWKSVKFPQNRKSAGAFEDLKLCFLKNEIELTFGILDHKKSERTWSASYKDASSNEPHWKALNYSKSCPNTFIENNDSWHIERDKDGFKMVYKTMDTSQEVPTLNSCNQQLYTVQLGAFDHKESLESMEKILNSLKSRLISKELLVNNKKKYKLFIDSFSDYATAKSGLDKLKRIYTKNKIIQGAYVTKLP